MSTEVLDVLIIGAGLSGVGAAARLAQDRPGDTVLVLESRERMGGTWDLFRYPGVRSDSDMYTFGYAHRPWTNGRVFASGPEIRRYIEDTAEAAGVTGSIRYRHRATTAAWDSARARWEVEAETPDGPRRFEARFLILCAGYYRYDHGYLPALPGMTDYAGTLIHPQHWPDDLQLAGRRVLLVGSGATAITLLPALVSEGADVTLVQRSPTWIAALPSHDGLAQLLHRLLPAHLAHRLLRTRNITIGLAFFQLSRRWPTLVRRLVLGRIRRRLGPDAGVDIHFNPHYDPWDQRFCVAPDGDFFDALAGGQARMVTGEIERVTAEGLEMRSGESLAGDVLIMATGLEMQVAGGMTFSVDGQHCNCAQQLVYRGMMLSGLPNVALAFGYTNASWTLKVDLTFARVCRLLDHLERHGHDYCVPIPPTQTETLPLLDFSSGYVQRALPMLPRQGSRAPWRTRQNYLLDWLEIRHGRIDDGHLQFRVAGTPVADGSSA